MFVFAARADFLIDQGKQQWNGEAEKQHDEQDRLDDVDDIPGDPALGERPEGADSIGGRVVQQNVAEAGEAGIQKKQSPARRKIGIARFAAAEAPDPVDKRDHGGGDERYSKKRVGKAAVMIQPEGGTAEAAQDIEIGGLGSEGEGERGERGLAIEAGAAQVGAEQEVGDGFQV